MKKKSNETLDFITVFNVTLWYINFYQDFIVAGIFTENVSMIVLKYQNG